MLRYIKHEQVRIFWDYIHQKTIDPTYYEWILNNPNITLDIIRNNLNYNWNYYFVSSNPNITWEMTQENLDIPWNYSEMSHNPNINWEIERDNSDKFWSESGPSWNPNTTWKMVRDNPDIDWEYVGLSSNPNITWKNVQDTPDKDWVYSELAKNPNITLDIINQNPDKLWGCSDILQNPNITWDMILKKPIKSWPKSVKKRKRYIEDLQGRPYPIWDMKLRNSNKTNSKRCTNLSENPNITWDIIHRNQHLTWCDSGLVSNSFTLQNELIKRRCMKKWVITNKMKSRHKNTRYDPNDLECKQDLMNFMNSF
jgi:hypothetical protein